MITVNAMGDSCPIPVIKTKKAMQALTGPETIEVLVDNEIAVQNVTKMASSSGGKVTSEKLGEKEYMLFYNGGATLTCEGSDSLEDLKSLEAQGVNIMTCGTCLDYYGIKEKLAVGSVTNMYVIAETMAGADKIIRP